MKFRLMHFIERIHQEFNKIIKLQIRILTKIPNLMH